MSTAIGMVGFRGLFRLAEKFGGLSLLPDRKWRGKSSCNCGHQSSRLEALHQVAASAHERLPGQLLELPPLNFWLICKAGDSCTGSSLLMHEWLQLPSTSRWS